jgi:transcriptional regulator with XRE-family HTH domain
MTRSPTEIDREIGQRIRLARKQAKLSQSELGQAIGVTYQQVQKYENGTDRVAASRLVQIATVLEQPASALLGGVEHGQARLMDEDAIALVALFNEIKRPALRGAALQTVKSLVAAGNEV